MDNLSIGTATTQAISSPAVKPVRNANDVDFEVKYSKDFKGERHMPEGPVVLSKEVAAQFAALGIGQIVEDEKPETAKVVPVKADDLIAQINAAETTEAVEALLQDGEARKTVLAAADARKKALTEPA